MAYAHHSSGLRALDWERRRLATLVALGLLDTPPEREFDTLVAAARQAFGCKIALISLIDENRQWFKARCGLDCSETPREHAFCAHAIEMDDMLVVADATADPRFAMNPLVLGAPHIRFYAGMPIKIALDDGAPVAIGTLCVIDDEPRQLTTECAEVLRDLAHLAEVLISARISAATAVSMAQERQVHLLKLDRQHRQFRQAERMANIGSWRMTIEGSAPEWSDQVYVIHGLPVGKEPPLQGALDFYPPHARELISTALTRTVETGQPFDLEADFITACGSKRRVRCLGELELCDGKPVGVIGVFQDVTSRYAMEQALRRTANMDDLTRIANRARFNQILDEKICEAREAGDSIALLLIDLDGFKQVNDRCGHLAGDELLQLIASRLQMPYLSGCFVARLGGDEFVLIVSDRADCLRFEQILLCLLADLRHVVSCEGGTVEVSGTIGISWLDGTVSSRSDMLHRADTALYEAKRNCRGSAKVFGNDRIIKADSRCRPRELRAVG